jgi:NADPH-dependent curcumin reductase CurA
MTLTVGAIAAGVVAAVLSSIEAASSKVGLALKAFGWLSIRLILDGAVGFLAFFPVHKAGFSPIKQLLPTGKDAIATFVVAVVSGAVGTAALRSYFINYGKGRGAKQVGLVGPYEKLKDFTDERIVNAVANARTDWLRKKVQPALQSVSSDIIIDDVITFLHFRGTSRPSLARIRGELEALKDNPGQRIDLFKAIITNNAISRLKILVKENS